MPPHSPLPRRLAAALLGVLLILLLVRALAAALVPLGDTTEARYAQVARLMLASGDWVTPQNDPGVPFSAKPPLSFWAQAATMAIFGVNEFGARASSLAFAALTGALLWRFARATDAAASVRPWFAVAMLATMPLYFMLSGAVLTDMALAACLVAAMTGFWSAYEGRGRGYAFFAALGLALLAKGPVAVAIAGLALLLFVLVQPDRRSALHTTWRNLPWLRGAALLLAVAAPWYAMAELRTPGFLDYFLVGEHLQRFIVADWPGDRYGNAHREARGTIWLFLLCATATWLPFIAALVQRRRRGEGPANTSLDRYLLAWALAAPLLFTLGRNTIWSYVLPSLPPLALWLARRLPDEGSAARGLRAVAGVTVAASTIALATIALVWMSSEEMARQRSTRDLVAAVRTHTHSAAPRLLAVRQLPNSTKFYARDGFVKVLHEQALAALDTPGEVFVMIVRRDFDPAIAGPAATQLAERLQVIGRYGDFVLLHRR